MRLWEDYEQYDDGGWVHYSNVDFLTINPQPGHLDMAGIYLFPDRFRPTSGWRSYPYKLLVDVPRNLRVFDFADVTWEQALEMYNGLRFSSPKKPDAIIDQKVLRKYGRSPGDTLWTLMRDYLGYGAKKGTWNKLFRQLGYDALFDDTGAIFSTEVQLIVLDPRKVKVVDIIRNSGTGYKEVVEIANRLAAVLKDHLPYVTVSKPNTRPTPDGPQVLVSVKASSRDPNARGYDDDEVYTSWSVRTRPVMRNKKGIDFKLAPEEIVVDMRYSSGGRTGYADNVTSYDTFPMDRIVMQDIEKEALRAVKKVIALSKFQHPVQLASIQRVRNANRLVNEVLAERAEWDRATVLRLVDGAVKPLGFRVLEVFGPDPTGHQVPSWPGLRGMSRSAFSQAMSEVVYVGVQIDTSGSTVGVVWPKLKKLAAKLKKASKLVWVTTTKFEAPDYPLNLIYYAPIVPDGQQAVSMMPTDEIDSAILLFAMSRMR